MFASDGFEESFNDPFCLASARRVVTMPSERHRIVPDERMPKLLKLGLLIGVEEVSFMSDAGIKNGIVILFDQREGVLVSEVERTADSQKKGLESLRGIFSGADVIGGNPNGNCESRPDEAGKNGVNPRKTSVGYYVSFGAQIFVVLGVLLLIIILLTLRFHEWLSRFRERAWKIY